MITIVFEDLNGPPNLALRSDALQQQISILGVYQNNELLKIEIYEKHS